MSNVVNAKTGELEMLKVSKAPQGQASWPFKLKNQKIKDLCIVKTWGGKCFFFSVMG